jgi:hypothetical protein
MQDPAIGDRSTGPRASEIDGMFVLEGELGGRAVRVTWRSRTLTGDAELIDLATLVVDAGETYVDPDGLIVPASFDTMPGAILAACRAVDRLRVIEISTDN